MIVEKVIPPIMEIPSDFHISDPCPVPIARGTIPRIVVRVVINTGRNLERPPCTTAVIMDIPLSPVQVDVVDQHDGVLLPPSPQA
jgi:hypothetical protein